MKIATVIKNIVTQLEAMTWTSDSGAGTTKFQDVRTTQAYTTIKGYPIALVYDTRAIGTAKGIKHYYIDTPLIIDVCISPDAMDKASELEKDEEAQLRLREAWDYMKTQIGLASFGKTVGADIISRPSYERFDLRGQGIDIIGLRISILIRETLIR